MEIDCIQEEQHEIDSINNSARPFHQINEHLRAGANGQLKKNQNEFPTQLKNYSIPAQHLNNQQQWNQGEVLKKNLGQINSQQQMHQIQPQSHNTGQPMLEGYEYLGKGGAEPQRQTAVSQNRNNKQINKQQLFANNPQSQSSQNDQKKIQQFHNLKMQQFEDGNIQSGELNSNKNDSLGSMQQNQSDQIFWPISPQSADEGITQILQQQLNAQITPSNQLQQLQEQRYVENKNIAFNIFQKRQGEQLKAKKQNAPEIIKQSVPEVKKNEKQDELLKNNDNKQQQPKSSVNKQSNNQSVNKNKHVNEVNNKQNADMPSNNIDYISNSLQEAQTQPKHIYLNLTGVSSPSTKKQNQDSQIQATPTKQQDKFEKIEDENKRKIIEQLFQSKQTYIDLKSGKKQSQQEEKDQINSNLEKYQQQQRQEQQEISQNNLNFQPNQIDQKENIKNQTYNNRGDFDNQKQISKSNSKSNPESIKDEQRIKYSNLLSQKAASQTPQKEAYNLHPPNQKVESTVLYGSTMFSGSQVENQIPNIEQGEVVQRLPQFMSFDSLVNSAKERANLDFIQVNNKTLEIKSKDSSFSSQSNQLQSESLIASRKAQHQQSQTFSTSNKEGLTTSPKIKLREANFFQKESTLERNDFWIKSIKSHKEQLAQHYKEENMKECSFSPNFCLSYKKQKCVIQHLNEPSQVQNSLNPNFHRQAAESKSSYSKLHAFKKNNGFLSTSKTPLN